VDWLASLPAGVLLLGCLAATAVAVIVGRALSPLTIPGHQHGEIRQIAGPLMPALGATFAVLAAITLSSEAGYLKSAQDIVSAEAAGASRLAWAATAPGVDGDRIQADLLAYLEASRTFEWRGDAAQHGDDRATNAAIVALERSVRRQAARPEIGTPASTELLASLDAITGARRARLAAAARELPALYVVTLVVSGLALIANAGALSAGVSRRFTLLLAGLTVVVALSLALLFSVTAPWRGPLIVSGAPIDQVARDLRTGFFSG
jgi:hypothetical protein